MDKLQVNKFMVVGISVRTTNANGQAKKDISELWGRFMSENMTEKISDIKDETIYAVYTDYESDHTEPYTTILGYRVNSIGNIPEGMVGKQIETANYTKFVAKGDLTSNAVVDQWNKIWNSDLDRTYAADFETYGEKAADPTNGEAEIYVSIK